MSQNAVVIPNTGTLTGLQLVNDVNAALDTVQSNNSGNSDPGAIGAYRLWADTLNDLLKIRNAANSGWIVWGKLSDLGIQSGIQNSCSAGGSADAITGSFTPAITALPAAGLRLRVRAGAANATTTPTFTPNSGTITAYTIVKGSNQALVAGDIAGAGMWLDLDWDNTLTKWVLLNPATGVDATVADATTSTKGKVQLADNSAAIALTSTTLAITPDDLAKLLNVIAGGAPIYSCRAWANFDGNSTPGTYTQSGTSVTVTITSHGGAVGQWVYQTFSSGSGVAGFYQITSVTTNTYTYTAGTSLSTSGNTARTVLVKASGNISNINRTGAGSYTITFSIPMDDTFYSVSGMCSYGTNASIVNVAASSGTVPVLKTVNAVAIQIGGPASGGGTNAGDCRDISLQIFR